MPRGHPRGSRSTAKTGGVDEGEKEISLESNDERSSGSTAVGHSRTRPSSRKRGTVSAVPETEAKRVALEDREEQGDPKDLTMADIEALSPNELLEKILECTHSIEDVASKSRNLKGSYALDLNKGAIGIRDLVTVLTAKSNREIAKLERSLRTAWGKSKALREEIAELKATPQSEEAQTQPQAGMEIAGPSDEGETRAKVNEGERILMDKISTLIDEKLKVVEALNKPPLRAVNEEGAEKVLLIRVGGRLFNSNRDTKHPIPRQAPYYTNFIC